MPRPEADFSPPKQVRNSDCRKHWLRDLVPAAMNRQGWANLHRADPGGSKISIFFSVALAALAGSTGDLVGELSTRAAQSPIMSKIRLHILKGT